MWRKVTGGNHKSIKTISETLSPPSRLWMVTWIGSLFYSCFLWHMLSLLTTCCKRGGKNHQNQETFQRQNKRTLDKHAYSQSKSVGGIKWGWTQALQQNRECTPGVSRSGWGLRCFMSSQLRGLMVILLLREPHFENQGSRRVWRQELQPKRRQCEHVLG